MARQPKDRSTARRPFPWGALTVGLGGVGLLSAVAWYRPDAAQTALAAGALAVLTLLAVALGLRRPRRDASVAEPAPATLAPSYETALEALPDPVLVVAGRDPEETVDRQVVFANAAAREFLHIPRDGALLVTVLRDPEVLQIVDEALFGGIEATTAFETRGAQERFWRAWTRPLPAPDPVGRFALLYMSDETDARRMEQMRADFLANASHELRTPLASLTGFIETLKGHARDDAKARDKFLDIMAAQAARMSRLIADLLSLSRIELNEHIPPSGRADLALVITDVVDALAPLARERGVTLTPLMPPPGSALVVGDRDQIVQVAQNLIDNALKYSSPGGAVEIEVLAGLTLDLALEPQERQAARLSLLTPDRTDAGRYCRIRVRDHGPGIARQHLPRLTERFYRVEGQKSGERLGTGLGLAIVKHIANRHRGGLVVESVFGEGAAFSVFFPQAVETVRRTERETEAA